MGALEERQSRCHKVEVDVDVDVDVDVEVDGDRYLQFKIIRH